MWENVVISWLCVVVPYVWRSLVGILCSNCFFEVTWCPKWRISISDKTITYMIAGGRAKYGWGGGLEKTHGHDLPAGQKTSPLAAGACRAGGRKGHGLRGRCTLTHRGARGRRNWGRRCKRRSSRHTGHVILGYMEVIMGAGVSQH